MSTITFLQEIPIAIPISLIVISVCLTTYGVIRIVSKYKRWEKIRELKVPHLKRITDTLQKMHLRLTELAKSASRRKIQEDKFVKAIMGLCESIGISEEMLVSSLLPDPKNLKAQKKILKRINKSLGFKSVEDEKGVSILVGIGSFLDLNDIGLSKVRDNDRKYQASKNQLKRLREIMNITSAKASKAIDDIILLSYGLNSFLLFNLIWLKQYKNRELIQDKYPARMVEFEQHIDGIYNNALLNLKKNVIDALLKEGK